MWQRKNFLFMKEGHETCHCIDQVSAQDTEWGELPAVLAARAEEHLWAAGNIWYVI